MGSLLKLAHLHNTYLHGDESNPRKFEIAKEVDIDYCIPDDLDRNKQDANYSGYNCLHIAAMNSDDKMVEYFMSQGADPFKQGTFDGCTPIHTAINNHRTFWKKHYWELTGLLQQNKAINVLLSTHVKSTNTSNPKCNNGISHLHAACMFDHIEAIEYFLKIGEPVNQVTNADSHWPGYAPLHFAVRYSSVCVAEILLKNGADVHKKDSKGSSPLHLVVERLISTHDYIFMAMPATCSPYQKEAQRIDKLLCFIIEAMSQKNSKILTTQDSGLTRLYLACMIEEPSILMKFLDFNLNINVAVNKNSQFWPGWTPLHFAACTNHEKFKVLLEHGAEINVKNAEGDTPLDLCLKRIPPESFYFMLLTKPVLMNTVLSDSRTYLRDVLLAMSCTHRFEELLDSLENVNISVPLDSPIWPGYSILHLAISSNHKFKFCEEFHETTDFGKNAFPCLRNYRCTDDADYFSTRYWKVIAVCLTSGCSVIAKNANGETPMHMAFKLCNEPLVEQLLEYNIEKDVVSLNNLSILHIACVTNNVDLVQRLLDTGSDVDLAVKREFQWYEQEKPEHKPGGRRILMIKVEANSTVLHMAVKFRNKEMIELILTKGANVYATDSNGSTPIHLSMPLSEDTSDAVIATLLFSRMSKLRNWVNKDGLSHVHIAAFADDKRALERLIKKGANVEVTTRVPDRFAGQTALHLAADVGSFNAVKTLIKAGARSRAENELKRHVTPLIYAVRRLCKLTIMCFVKKLRLNDCNVGPVDASGLTLLHLACAALDFGLVNELLREGADPNAQVRMDMEFGLAGFTALHVISSHVKKDDETILPRIQKFVDLLLDNGANVTIKSRERGSPVHMVYVAALRSPSLKDIDILAPYEKLVDSMLSRQISYDVNPLDNSTGNRGFSHFHLACATNNVWAVEKFLDCGVDVHHKTDPLANDGNDGLHFAAIYYCCDVARLLLGRGANVNAQNAKGDTAFHAVMMNEFETMNNNGDFTTLLQNGGANVKARNCGNETPLDCLIKSYGLNLDWLKFFIECGCSIDMMYTRRFKEGITGLALKAVDRTEIASLLETLIEACKLREKIEMGFNAVLNVTAITNWKGYFPSDTYLKIFMQFIDMGCDIDQQEVDVESHVEQRESVGDTALHVAMHFLNFEATHALLLLGADINITNLDDRTPFGVHYVPIKSTNEEVDRVIVKIAESLAAHVWKMKLIGFNLHPSNEIYAERIHEINPMDPDIEYDSLEELIKMEGVEIDFNFTVINFLMKKDLVNEFISMPLAKREAIYNFFQNSSLLISNFPQFCGLLLMKYRKIQNRLKIWAEAKDALIFVSQIHLPDLCVGAIFQFLSNDDLKNLISMFDIINISSLTVDSLSLQEK